MGCNCCTTIARRRARRHRMEETTQLAPAAGSGIGKILAAELVQDPAFIGHLKSAYMDALTAEQFFYDKGAKEWRGEPDYKTRLAAANSIMAHMEGDPIKRIIHQRMDGPTPADALETALESPALVDAMELAVQKARNKQRKAARLEKKAEPAAIEPEIEV